LKEKNGMTAAAAVPLKYEL